MRFYFQAQGLPRPAMYNNIGFLFVNALLNWFLVFGGPLPWNGLGFIGAAISLSISRTMQSVVYFFYMFVYKKHHTHTWPGLSLKHHTRARTVEFMKQSLPNVGTLLFSQVGSQATTVLVGRLGELAIATSSALSTVTIPWSGTLSATCWTVSSVRVGYHLGRGDGDAARAAARIVIVFITVVNIICSAVFLPFGKIILDIATDDGDVLSLGAKLIPAMLVGTYLNILTGNISGGVFSGMGRPIIATILSFGFELPLSIGGVALYILYFHGNLIGVYWWQAISGGLEAVLVIGIMSMSNWGQCAVEAQNRNRQETSPDETEIAQEPVSNEEEEDSAQETVNLLEGGTDEEKQSN
jgi:MATE family multidrug resistance protein